MTAAFDFSQAVLFSLNLKRASKKVQDRASAAVRKTAFDIERDAKRLAPVDTGFLQGSITVSIRNKGLFAEIGPTASYGAYVEFGTSRMAPRPYMRPATERHVPSLREALAQASVEAL